jgi:predicted nucleic acid-binding protein
LEEGIVQTADPARYRRTLKALMKEVRIWPTNWDIVDRFGELARLAKNRGRALSTTDILLASFAWENGITLLTADKDFQTFPEIKTENWGAAP